MVIVDHTKKTNPNKMIGRKWWKCNDGVAVENRERVKSKYEGSAWGRRRRRNFIRQWHSNIIGAV